MEGDGLHHGHGPRDALTGLPGLDVLQQRIGEWQDAGTEPLARAHVHAMLVRLRRFDAVNLAYGAAAGDGALAKVAVRMVRFANSELEGQWIVSRSSGGSFLLAARERCSRERWQLVAEQLADAIARPIAVPAGLLRLSPRIGLLRGLEGETADSMLDRLGHALAGAERKPGMRLAWADGDITPPGHSAAELEADLLGAIDNDEIEIVYQPQFRLPDEILTGAEALARWNHPRLGRIGAETLFALAERTDHVAPLSRHIARRALEGAALWPADLRLSLNVTPADLASGSYAAQLCEKIAETGFPAERLTLEVTEQALLHDIDRAARTMAELSAKGVRIALDDFGAGFCNFRYLKVLPLHYLKLDRTMIDGITSDPRDLAIFRAMVAMAGALDLEVIAEGVEDEAQRALIAREGCRFYQGFLRAPPMEPAHFLDLAED